MDEDGLLFRSGSRHLLRREHIDTFHQSPDDLGIQFLDLGVFFDLRKEGIDVDALHLGLGNGVSEDDHPTFKVFLFLLIGNVY